MNARPALVSLSLPVEMADLLALALRDYVGCLRDRVASHPADHYTNTDCIGQVAWLASYVESKRRDAA